MFSWVYNTYRRHKRKLVLTALLGGGSYVLYKYGMYKFEEWQNKKLEEMVFETKRQQYFETMQKTCSEFYIKFLPNLTGVIMEKMDVEELLEILKLKPTNKLEIWERLKLISMSRLLCSMIASSTLLVFLKVQLNIMGGYLFVEMKKSGDKSTENKLKEEYLNNVKYLLEQGLLSFINDCEEVVKTKISSVPLKEKFSHQQLHELFIAIIEEWKEKKSVSSEKHPFCEYFIDPEWSEATSIVDSEYSKWTSETINVLESKDCCRVLNEQISSGLNKIMDLMKEDFFGFDEEKADKITSLEDCVATSFYESITLPYAKIIPLLNHKVHDVLQAGQNDFIDTLSAQPLIRQFTENIYEAFSKEYT